MAIVDTAVIGGGQAGLAVAWHLRRTGLEHVVLDDQPGPGNSVAGPSNRTEWEIFSRNGGWQGKRSQTDQQTSGQALHWA